MKTRARLEGTGAPRRAYTGPMKVLELFAGIGGCAMSGQGGAEGGAAVDQDEAARATYAIRFDHPQHPRNLHHARPEWFARFDADLWWMSPPCQPYTRRGLKRDVDDSRAQGLLSLLPRIDRCRPPFVALEKALATDGSSDVPAVGPVIPQRFEKLLFRDELLRA